jgi:lysophospholipase L1-like esterase
MNKQLSILLSIICLAFCLLLSGCGKKSVQLQPLDKEKPILAFGDSLTAGYGTSEEYSYPTVLANISGYKVINAGISGETSAGGLERFEKTLKDTKPSLVILMEGGNDILQSVPPEQTKANLIAMINIAKEQNVQVLLIGIPKKSLIGSSVASIYPEIAKQTGVLSDEKTIPSLIKKNELKSDLVHFNQQGYAVIAQKFYDDLKNAGAFKN